MGKKLRIGKATLEMKSYDGPCILFGNTRCTAYDKKTRQAQKDLPKEERCKGDNRSCEFYIGSSPFVPAYDEKYLLPEKETEILALALQHGDNVLLYGPPGSGKSSLGKQIASILNWGMEQYDCSEETTSAKILGQWVVVGDEMAWNDGCITNAMRNGFILLEDEVDFMRPELRGEIHGIMETSGTLTLSGTHPETGKIFREVIKKHPNFRWISTANTIGYGDDLFAFHGTQYMNAASRDRYEIIVQFGYRPPEEEKEIIIAKTGIDSEKAEKMIEIANECRNENKEMLFQFSMRRLLSWAKYWNRVGPELSSQLAILNFCNNTDRHTVKALMRTHLNLEL